MVSIQEHETKLTEKKRHLENFQSEFCDIKKKYEEACKKLEEDITETVELIQERDQAYSDYIEQSGTKYSHVPPTRQQMNQGVSFFGIYLGRYFLLKNEARWLSG